MSSKNHATTVTEVAPDLFRLSTFVPAFGLQFNQFLVRDEEPLLFHTGMRGLFPAVRDAVAEVLDPKTLRWVSFSHFEADESGALDDWLRVAPSAQAACGALAAMVSVDDVALRPARGLAHDEVLTTGRFRFRYRATPHVPHGWDAGLLFEETTRALFCSDLFFHGGDVEAVTRDDLVARYRDSLTDAKGTPLDFSVPYTEQTRPILQGIAALAPAILLPMHGSAWQGDGERAVLAMADMLDEVLGSASQAAGRVG